MSIKNYLIIGGSFGIGEAVVKNLQNSGHHIYVVSRSVETEKNDNINYIKGDITDKEIKLDKLPESLDGLVYAPGTLNLRPFQSLKEENFQHDMEVNYFGAVRALKLALPRLKKAADGASVVLFSTVAVQLGMPYHASIAGAKGAVEGLTRSLAAEWAPKIRVNAVAPSLTDTRLSENLLNTEQKLKSSAERHPLKRIGRPQDIAEMVAFLLSDKSSWITGQILHIDGGLSSVKLL